MAVAQPESPPLSFVDVQALKDGERIIVIWSGGNGPHEYVVVNDCGKVYAGMYNVPFTDKRHQDRPLDFIGDRSPFTRVWRSPAE